MIDKTPQDKTRQDKTGQEKTLLLTHRQLVVGVTGTGAVCDGNGAVAAAVALVLGRSGYIVPVRWSNRRGRIVAVRAIGSANGRRDAGEDGRDGGGADRGRHRDM